MMEALVLSETGIGPANPLHRTVGAAGEWEERSAAQR